MTAQRIPSSYDSQGRVIKTALPKSPGSDTDATVTEHYSVTSTTTHDPDSGDDAVAAQHHRAQGVGAALCKRLHVDFEEP